MPEHKHLRRLDSVWIQSPIFFVTSCTWDRRRILANFDTVAILRSEMSGAREKHGWNIGRYVIMPDHVHFFCASEQTPGAASLSRFVGAFKEWTAKRMVAAGAKPPVWQKQFFDHVLRSEESYTNKWVYVRENPVRAGLVTRADDWPHAGEIAALL